MRGKMVGWRRVEVVEVVVVKKMPRGTSKRGGRVAFRLGKSNQVRITKESGFAGLKKGQQRTMTVVARDVNRRQSVGR
jgi:imidazolonepropionase-like amidohydrolase